MGNFLSPAAQRLRVCILHLKLRGAEMDDGDGGGVVGGAVALPIRMTKALEERPRAVFS